MHRLSQYINTIVRISSAGVFADQSVHACTLLAVDDNGLWLQSEELMRRLYGAHEFKTIQYGTPVFVPYAQIAYLTPGIVSIGGTRQGEILRERRGTVGAAKATSEKAVPGIERTHPAKPTKRAPPAKTARRER